MSKLILYFPTYRLITALALAGIFLGELAIQYTVMHHHDMVEYHTPFDADAEEKESQDNKDKEDKRDKVRMNLNHSQLLSHALNNQQLRSRMVKNGLHYLEIESPPPELS